MNFYCLSTNAKIADIEHHCFGENIIRLFVFSALALRHLHQTVVTP